MNGDEKEKGMSSDPRIMLLVGALLLSLILLFLPAVFPELNYGGLKYGLDLDGGSWLQLRPEGAIAQIDADIGKIISHEYEAFLNDSVTITQKTQSSVSFEIDKPVTAKQIESLGYGQANVSTRAGVTTVVLQVDETQVISRYLENNYAAEVVVFEDRDGIWYEIRKKTSPEELNSILEPVDGSVLSNKSGVSQATLVKTKQILEDKLNLFGLSDVKPRIVGREFILIDLAGIDIDTAMDLAATPGKFEIRVQTSGNESEHAVYGEDIQTVGFHRNENDEEIYGAPLSPTLAQSMKEVSIQLLVASFGADDGSYE
jgi:preprotein translocase subunit SecD